MKHIITGRLLLLTSTVGWSSTALEATISNSTELSILVYNTHGLPAVFARDKPSNRFPKIGNLTARFDLLVYRLCACFGKHEQFQKLGNI